MEQHRRKGGQEHLASEIGPSPQKPLPLNAPTELDAREMHELPANGQMAEAEDEMAKRTTFSSPTDSAGRRSYR